MCPVRFRRMKYSSIYNSSLISHYLNMTSESASSCGSWNSSNNLIKRMDWKTLLTLFVVYINGQRTDCNPFIIHRLEFRQILTVIVKNKWFSDKWCIWILQWQFIRIMMVLLAWCIVRNGFLIFFLNCRLGIYKSINSLNAHRL